MIGSSATPVARSPTTSRSWRRPTRNCSESPCAGSTVTCTKAENPPGWSCTIQSASKPFVYSLALDDRGLDAVHSRVGAEPSGEAFNSVKLEAITGRPPNPMVNAGAIVTTSLVAGDTPEDRFARILARLSAFAGRDLSVDEAVFASRTEFR